MGRGAKGKNQRVSASKSSPPPSNKCLAADENSKGLACYQQKDYAKAVEHYSKAFSLNNDVQYLLNSAEALYDAGDYLQCIKKSQQAIMFGYQISADRQLLKKAFMRVGKARLKQGRVEDARKYFDSLMDCPLSEEDKVALGGLRTEVDCLEGKLKQSARKSRFVLLRPRARLLTPDAAVPLANDNDIPSSRSIGIAQSEYWPPGQPELDLLIMDMGTNGYSNVFTRSLANRLRAQDKKGKVAWKKMQLTVAHQSAEVIAREVCMSLICVLAAMVEEKKRKGTPVSYNFNLCTMRLRALYVFLENSMFIPSYFRGLLTEVLRYLIHISATPKTFKTAMLDIDLVGGGSESLAMPLVVYDEETLIKCRHIWSTWVSRQEGHGLTLLYELGLVPNKGEEVTPLSSSYLDDRPTLMTDVISHYRTHLEADALPNISGLPDLDAAHQSEVLDWFRFFVPMPSETIRLELAGQTACSSAVDTSSNSTSSSASSNHNRISILMGLLETPCRPIHDDVLQWKINPLFIKEESCRNYCSLPLDPDEDVNPLHMFQAPDFVDLFSTPETPDHGPWSLFERMVQKADTYIHAWRDVVYGYRVRVTLNFFVSKGSGMQMVCNLAAEHNAPHMVAQKIDAVPNKGNKSGTPDVHPTQIPSDLAFDVIDATHSSLDNSLLALLLALPGLLKHTGSAFLLTHHSHLDTIAEPSHSDFLAWFETLTGANEEMLQVVLGVKFDVQNQHIGQDSRNRAQKYLARWSLDAKQVKKESEDSEGLRRLFWKVIQACLFPKTYKVDDVNSSIQSRFHPTLETTGILLALFDLVYRNKSLPGQGFVEALLDDSFFQGMSTSFHLKTSLQTLCRQYLGTFSEHVVAAPALYLNLGPINHYKVTLKTLTDLTKRGLYDHDTVPLAALLISPEAQVDNWLRFSGSKIIEWITQSHGKVQVIDSIEILTFTPESVEVALYLPQHDVWEKGAAYGKILILVHWECSQFLTQPIGTANLTLLDKTGRPKKKKKKKQKEGEDTSGDGDDGEAGGE